MNMVMLEGKVYNDPRIGTGKSGNPWGSVMVETPPRPGQSRTDKTMVKVFGDLATRVGQLRKGDSIRIDGHVGNDKSPDGKFTSVIIMDGFQANPAGSSDFVDQAKKAFNLGDEPVPFK
jgi:single-stranded DNA-binding protein